MQQTDKYKLNLIEKTDVFSPDPLNGNAEKLEGALEAVRAEAAAGDAALGQRLQACEARRFACGTYVPHSAGVDIDLGFQPAIVLIQGFGTFLSGVLTQNIKSNNGAITPNGFRINAASQSGTITCGNYKFGYFAFG